MQLNGGTTMAASEPPEPPPRNPDRINASLNKFNDTKITKSLDTNDKPVTNNNKLLRPILSLDNNSGITSKTGGNCNSGGLNVAGGSSSSSSSITSPMNPIRPTLPPTAKKNDVNNQSSNNSSSSPILQNLTNNGSNSYNQITGAENNHQKGASTSPSNMVTEITSNSEFKHKQMNNRIENEFMNGTTTSSKTDSNNLCNSEKIKENISPGNNHSETINLNGQITTQQQQQLLINDFNQKGNNLIDNNKEENGICEGNRNDDLKFDIDKEKDPTKLRFENEKLINEIGRLRKLLEISPDGAVGGVDLSDSNSCDAQSTDGSTSKIERLESELKLAKSQMQVLKLDRKKLKSDKNDLLAHVKQLCGSLQDKEQELRDFIRNFEQRIRETETSNAKISSERERERWSLLKHARDEAERSLALAQQLNARDMQLQRTQEQLQEARRQLTGCLSDQESLLSFAPLTPPSSGLMGHLVAQGSLSGPGFTTGSCSADSGVRGSSDRESATGDINFSDGTCENGPCITVDADSISIVSSQLAYQYGTPKERSPTLSPLNSAAYSRSVEQLGSPCDSEGPSALTRKFANKTGATGTLSGRSGRGGTWGSISRVFARSRNKNKANSQDNTEATDFTSWSPLTEEGYAEKLRLLREASQVPIDRWRASQVLAWLEVALGMPQYSTRCSENVKSGKVLLELNDSELETGLGLAHPMHRKKLRLAIEEQRRPDLVRYPSIAQLGHTWVASEWLPDIGLPQYAESFIHSLVDARMLDTLSKKELEKFLGVTRKFHQASIVHGIHVLRIVKYDRQSLAMRRAHCENVDADPIVWTNQRFIRWARSIDLAEYADNLKDSGVHGGLVVLEPSFSGETMATALGIPQSKNIIRKHLATEFDGLILPARATLGQGIRSGCGVVPITGLGGLQQHFVTVDRKTSGSFRISGWKGSQSSLSRAFKFNTKSKTPGNNNEKHPGNSTSPTPSYSSSESSNFYAILGSGISFPNLDKNFKHCQLPAPTTAPPPPPPSHRVSAPPANNGDYSPISPLDHEHRRVKSVSDFEIVSAPV